MQTFQDVFISYGRKDSLDFAAKLNRHLVDRNFTVWFDFDNIPGGVDYQKQIDDGIERSDNFVFIISPHAVNSAYCLKEIKLALTRNKRIIPLLHVERVSRETWQERHPDGTDTQWQAYQAQGLHDHFQNMHPELRKLNWVYFREGIDDFDAAFKKLVGILGLHQAYVRQHTTWLIKALEWEREQQRSQFLLVGEERLQAEDWLKTRFKDSQPPCLPTDLHCELITESLKNADNLMTQVFLSYADEERSTAQKIRYSLMREGFTVWINTHDIGTGIDWQNAIDRGIEEADNIVYLMSPAAVQSEYCQREIEYGLALHKRIVPILAATLEPSQIPSALRNLQYIDLTDNVLETDYQQDESQLIRALRDNAAYHEDHKILLAKALKWQRQQQNPTFLLRGYNLRYTEAWLKVAHQTPTHSPTAVQEEFIAASLRQPPGGSLDVFISYSRVDSGLARQLNELLQIHGKRTWLDQESIAAGTADFQTEIHRGIESADHFLFILSPNAVESPYCADEVEYAARLNKRFVTILHRSIDPSTLHPELAKVQWLDISQPDGHSAANFRALLRILDTDAEHLHAHTRLLVRAIEWDGRGRNDSFLLRGDDLDEAEGWLTQGEAKQPQPTDLHRAYISTSHTVEQAQKILLKAGKTAKRRIRIGSAVMGVMLAIAAGFAFVTQQRINDADRKVQAAEGRVSAADRKVQMAEQKVVAATQHEAAAKANVQQADRKLKLANQAAQQAKQTAQLAAGQSVLSQQAAQRAAVQKTQAEQAKAVAQQQLQAASMARAKAETEAQQAKLAQDEAKQGTEIERLVTQSLRQFETQPLRGLLSALNAGQELQALVKQKAHAKGAVLVKQKLALSEYPAYSPIYSLHQILSTIQTREIPTRQGKVYSLSWSPDKQTLATGGNDGTVKLWTRTGELVKTLNTQQGIIYSVSWSLDGQTLATGGEDGTVKLWTRTGELVKTLTAHKGIVYSASWNLDRQTLATGGKDGTVKLWTRTGELIKSITAHKGWVLSVDWSPDGQTLATGGDDGTVKLWTRTDELVKSITAHTDTIWSVGWSPDGQTLATGGNDSTVQLWTRTGEPIKTLTAQQGKVYSVNWSSDGQTLATGGENGTVRLWTRTGELVKTVTAHSEIYGVSWGADGQTLATGDGDGAVQLWTLTKETVKPLTAQQGKVLSVSWSPNGQTLATGGSDGTVQLWTRTGERVKSLNAHKGNVWSVSWSQDGQTLATGGSDGTVKLWTRIGELVKPLTAQQGKVLSVGWSPDGQTLATGSSDGTVQLWTRTGKLVKTLTAHKGWVLSVDWSPDGQTLATGGDDGTVKLWTRIGELVKPLTAQQGKVYSVGWSPDGQTLVTGGGDGSVKLWTRIGVLVKTLNAHKDLVWSVSWSSDGQTLATSSSDGTAKLWSQKGEPIATIDAQQGNVNSVSWSPDGQTLATGGENGTVKLWPTEDLDALLTRGCRWASSYLIGTPSELQTLTICQTPKRLRAAAPNLVADSEELARLGNIEAAIQGFKTAQQWGAHLTFDPVAKANELAKSAATKR